MLFTTDAVLRDFLPDDLPKVFNARILGEFVKLLVFSQFRKYTIVSHIFSMDNRQQKEVSVA